MNGEVDAWVVVFSQLSEILIDGGRPSFAAKLRRAVAPPNSPFGFAVRDDVLVTVVKENLAAFGRLSEEKLLVAELLAANDLLGNPF